MVPAISAGIIPVVIEIMQAIENAVNTCLLLILVNSGLHNPTYDLGSGQQYVLFIKPFKLFYEEILPDSPGCYCHCFLELLSLIHI